MTSARQRTPVYAGLNYLRPGQDRPVSYAFQPPPGLPWESAEYELRTVPIRDGRDAVGVPNVDREGFELRDAPSSVADFTDEDAVKADYYAECAELALAVTGASEAYVFDHLLRKSEANRAPLSFGRRGADGRPAANGRIHNDYTEASGRTRLELVLNDRARAARVGRYAIVNIWRSIKGPILDTPLAVCDARSVVARDLVASEVRYPQRTGEIYLATFSPAHRWSYFSAMDRHEALVFKQYDAQLGGVARFTPHAAFDHPAAPAEAPPRESIEVRCLVVYA
ncbi:MAG: methyltransferase [Burkholderiales bacterium]|nr:methyltransferase [Burkholderiales bacterium]